ncbi:MAG: FHA domain-containing protein [Proteobacteria bacterium]|nr:FHA domain-containing protein [Pseudomonadota bacterium]
MPLFKTFTIGSGSNCDIKLDRSSIAAIHAELVIAKNGKLHLTDRASKTGTFRKQGEQWVPLVQDYIQPTEPVRFGDYHTSVSTLLNIIAPDGVDRLSWDGAGSNGGYNPKDVLPTGRVRRSSETGEIVPVKDD